MTRKECLDAAAECVLKDRQNQYGKPEDCFATIAAMWSAYLGCNVAAHDVAAMMALLKIARFRHCPDYADNAVDLAGYAACMIETATAWEREGEDSPASKSGDELVVLWKHKPKAEAEGCEELVRKDDVFDAPQTTQELCSKILESNPATYGRARKPTGEELAEMAEEDAHE